MNPGEATKFVQIVVSELYPSAAGREFLKLHRQTAEWMERHPECLTDIAIGMQKIVASYRSFLGKRLHFQ